MPLIVKATSCAVTGVPFVKLASSRIVKVQVKPSSEQLYEVARSFSKPICAFVVISVD